MSWTDKLSLEDCIEILNNHAKKNQDILVAMVLDRLLMCIQEMYIQPVPAQIEGETRPVYRWPTQFEIAGHLAISHSMTNVEAEKAMGYHVSLHMADASMVDHVHINLPENQEQ